MSGGGDNTMMYVGVLACCCSVSSSAASIFLNPLTFLTGAFLMSRKKKSRGRRGRRGRRMRRRCFSPETLIKLQNGETRAMKNLELGDVLINGSIVKATMQIKNESETYYKLPGDILVTGSHYIKDGDTYKQVTNFSKAEATTQIDDVVCCLVTSDHKIPVGDFVFWDWEDNLVQQ
jgi:hypothetical protein